MLVPAPDWLRKRGGDLKLGSDHRTWFVVFDHNPQYSLVAVPTKNEFGCAIRQTINGQRIECASVVATKEQAIGAGLEALRTTLGWDA